MAILSKLIGPLPIIFGRGIRLSALSRIRDFNRAVVIEEDDLMQAKQRRPISPRNAKLLRLAVLGAANAGKSELTNQLVGASVSAVSSKIDTTRETTTGVYTDSLAQLVVLDCPGTVSKQHAKKVMGVDPESAVVKDPERTVESADLILMVFDCTAPGEYLHHRLMHILHRHAHVPSILVMNKIDLITDRAELLRVVRLLTNGMVGGAKIVGLKQTIGTLVRKNQRTASIAVGEKTRDEEWHQQYSKLIGTPTYKLAWHDTKQFFRNIPGWGNFDAVFYTSALTGEGVDGLRSFLTSRAEKGDWPFHPSTVTNKVPQQLFIDCLRGKMLDHLPHRIAYTSTITVTMWEVSEGGVLAIGAKIQCPKKNWVTTVIGRGGGTVAEICHKVTQEMQNLFQREINVKLAVEEITRQ